MGKSKEPYGFELIMDLHDCDVSKFNKASLRKYFVKLCKAINMKRCELYFWDELGTPSEKGQTCSRTKGMSAVQFILTSSVVVHMLDLLKAVYINIFSCRSFDKEIAEKLTKEWFGAKKCKTHFIVRI